jgi:hypothetical protein
MKKAILAPFFFLFAFPAQSLTTNDLNTMTEAQLATLLAGSGAKIENVKFTGKKNAGGTFAGANIGVASGMILSTGDIATAAGPNNSAKASGDLGLKGDTDLDALIAPFLTNDAAILEFDVITESQNLGIRYVFASEEYPEYVGSQYNDVFAFFVDGQNIAIVPGGGEAVSVNSINDEEQSSLYRAVEFGSPVTQFDGFTAVLVAQTTVEPGELHHVKIAIADTSDSIYDSAVFIAEGGVTGFAPVTLRVDPEHVSLTHGERATFTVTASSVPEAAKLKLTTTAISRGTEVQFSPATLEGTMDRKAASVMDLTVGDDAFPKSHLLEIKATGMMDPRPRRMRASMFCAGHR